MLQHNVSLIGDKMPQVFGRSLHIGVNVLDPNHYAGYRATLKGCENDAWFMAGIARHYGFSDIRTLLGRQATADSVLDEIRYAAADIPEGGFFLLTFAGHGSQIPNEDQSDREKYDQTWCLYDRELIDDELRSKCWPLFRAGTRVLVIVDSCHSGSSIEVPPDFDARLIDRASCAIGGLNAYRVLPEAIALSTALLNRALYAAIRHSLAGKTSAKLAAAVLSIAACADSERTPDGDFGMFTAALRNVWDEGRFSGSHAQFFKALYNAVFTSYGDHPTTCCDDTITPEFLNAPVFEI